MKNIVIPILGAVSIISTGAVAWLLATPPAVDPRAVKLESDLGKARQEIANLKAELARKPAAPPPVVVADAPPGSDVAAVAPPATVRNSGNFRDVLSTPAMREVIDQQQAAQIDLGYGKLFEQLRLGPEDKEHFKKLLTARQKMQTEMGLQLMDPNITPQKRAEIMAEAKHQRSVYEASIKDFLNEANDYKTYQQWEETLPERTAFDTMGRSLFAVSAEPLSGTQEQQLLSLMAEVRLSPSSVGGLNDQTGGDPSKLTDAVIDQQMQQIDSNNRIIAERAEVFLTPVQRQTLKTYLDQMRTISRSGIEMFRGMNR